MALNQQEKDRLLELKAEGKTFTQALADIAGTRVSPVQESADTGSVFSEPSEPDTENTAGVAERLSDVGASSFDTIKQNIEGTGDFAGQSPIRRGVQATAEGFSTVPKGALALAPEPVREGVAKAGEVISKGFNAMTNFFGSSPQLQKFVTDNPEATQKIEEVLGTVAGAGEIAGTIAGTAGAVGTVNRTLAGASAGATKVATAVSTGIKSIDNAVAELQGVTTKGATGMREAVDLGLAPADIMQRVARISKGKQAKFEETAGQSVGEFLVERKIFGTPDDTVVSLIDNMKKSKGAVDSGLDRVKGVYKNGAVKDALDQLVAREKSVSTVGTPSRDIARITELQKLHQTTGLSLKQVNEVKRLYERNVRLNFTNPLDPKPDKLTQANNIDSALRTFVENTAAKGGFDNVRALNRETRLSKQLIDDIGAENAGKGGNNVVGLTDTILFAEALGNPVAAAGLAFKKVAGSAQAQAKLAEYFSRNQPDFKLPDGSVKQPDGLLTGYLKFLEDQAN